MTDCVIEKYLASMNKFGIIYEVDFSQWSLANESIIILLFG